MECGWKVKEEYRTSFPLSRFPFPVFRFPSLGRWVVAMAGENPAGMFGTLGATREADFDRPEDPITTGVGTLVTEVIALFEPRDEGSKAL